VNERQLVEKSEIFFEGGSLGCNQSRNALDTSSEIEGLSEEELILGLIIFYVGKAVSCTGGQVSNLKVVCLIRGVLLEKRYCVVVEFLVKF